MPAQLRVLASRYVKLLGARTRPHFVKTPYCRNVPIMLAPSPVCELPK